ncbi:hypothetical protein B7P43_G05007 [Cryptotermes secundus]|uniref:C2H2-type domain-containing protein n=2 Tax=Cryptotermes secundus TaxID=105785 RepID=A0A2J7PQQ0_9NEOP|nr:zinc finger protein OZF isoform X9 [Cryptotermes secundus]PNF18658.1 hypothetical protein B7P43_G05007 [Cryptotermes secundus]
MPCTMVNRANLETVLREDGVNIPSEVSGHVEEMSEQQDNTDTSPLTEFVKVEMTFDDMSEYAVEENADVNLTLAEYVKVELSVDDEHNSGSKETSVKMEKSECKENNLCAGQLCKDMLGATESEQINTGNILKGIAHAESSVDLQDKEEIGSFQTSVDTCTSSATTTHKHESDWRETDKHTVEYAKKYAASLMADPSRKLKRCSASLPRIDKHKEPTEDTDKCPFICQECGKCFKKIKLLREHSLMHTNGQSYECEICFKTFTQARYLKQHRRTHTRQRYECKNCGKSFLRIGYLEQHAHCHTGEKRYECKVCGKKFKDFSNHKRHLYIHTGERPFECHVCGKGFTQVFNLKQHLLIHSGLRPHECEICGKSFTQFHSLRLHSLIHTGERPHECNVCGMHFRVARSLKRHSLVHTGEHPYKCKNCGKGFTQYSILKTHSLIHTRVRPHKCEVCGKDFTVTRSLNRHLLTHRT